MSWSVTIDGDPVDILANSLRISQSANARTTVSFALKSMDASYRPPLDGVVMISDGAALVLGGLIDRPTESGMLRGKGPSIRTVLSVVDFQAYAERRLIKQLLPAGTMKAFLQMVVTYLAIYGVTLDPGQVDGPSLQEFDFDYVQAAEALNQAMTLTGSFGEPYAWSIDENKVLSAKRPSARPAPFDILTNAPGYVIGDITVSPSRDSYANRVIVKIPQKDEYRREETFTGDGVTDTFPLLFTPYDLNGYVSVGAVNENINKTGDTDPAQWTYNTGPNTITRNLGPPALGAAISIIFNGIFNGLGDATDASWATNPSEKVVQFDTLPTGVTAQAMAESLLAQALLVPKTIEYTTFTAGLRPGQSQLIQVPARDIDGSAVITDVETRDEANRLIYQITAVIDAQSNLAGRSWQYTVQKWSEDIAGAEAGSLKTTGGPPSISGPAPPIRSIQWNKNLAAFGGDENLLFDQPTLTVMLGPNHTEGGSINLLVGEGHTVT